MEEGAGGNAEAGPAERPRKRAREAEAEAPRASSSRELVEVGRRILGVLERIARALEERDRDSVSDGSVGDPKEPVYELNWGWKVHVPEDVYMAWQEYQEKLEAAEERRKRKAWEARQIHRDQAMEAEMPPPRRRERDDEGNAEGPAPTESGAGSGLGSDDSDPESGSGSEDEGKK